METPGSYSSDRKGIAIGQHVKRIREAQGLSSEGIASELGMDLDTYSKIESNESVVTDELLLRLSKALRVSLADLFTLQGPTEVSDNITGYGDSSSTDYSRIEVGRLEQLYHEQIRLLRDEVHFLRNMLDSVAKKN
jgi:transcriptional regulator with XRE-family HTH domain